MTEIDYLELIKQGAEPWNRWREDHPDDSPDLTAAYLFEADLREFNLARVNLDRACLIGANLQGANLQGANLDNAYGSKANVSHGNLHQANLSGADFSHAHFVQANLTQVEALGTNFSGATLTGACVQAWQVNAQTDLSGVHCDYVYWGAVPEKRQPSDRTFATDEFARWVRETFEPPVATSLPSPVDTNRPGPSQYPGPRWTLWAAGIGMVGLAIASLLVVILRPRPLADPLADLPSGEIDVSSLPCNEPAPGPLPNRPADYEYANGVEFYGSIENGAPADGRGTMVYPNGDRYDGEFQGGKRNGCGTFTFDSGRRYMGQFQDDDFQGIGIWMLEGGHYYIGQFQDNRCHGWGTFLFPDGSSTSGNWQDGRFVGDDTLSCDRGVPSDPKTTTPEG
ncbi:Pentapeptide repeat containing protein [Halomicronema hongdechloris C2206]|uniref:Pentapeptide repeat containing protein n=1 Tax=Halomicronema hongdechloris C2206 TaxID=1641165 RepID=A0A1Z3HUQ0_9CYAN|nr:pentapeptide repeat-containing protein [Halomicronema hongdechloris]ASC74034.1 Pentapeptide repeat containing protein [Halomicronema hongdechloris C2206]